MCPKHFSQSDKYDIKKLHKSQFTNSFSNWEWKYNLSLHQKNSIFYLILELGKTEKFIKSSIQKSQNLLMNFEDLETVT